MGCCGDEDHDVWERLISPSNMPKNGGNSPEIFQIYNEKRSDDGFEGNSEKSRGNWENLRPDGSASCSYESSSLSKDLWRSILERLSVAELARAACVCCMLNSIASESEVQMNAFKRPWKLKEVIGRPSSRSFWRDTTIGRFAISHKLKRGDTMAGLAVKYQVHVTGIRRLNNMMSDHGIHSRERLLIPVSQPEILFNGTCYIELDIYAKREVAVLYLEGGPDGKSSYLAITRPEKSKRNLLESMKRSFQADDGTVEYYLSVANGDLRAAFSQFSQDLRWEQERTTH